jgi:hypothetical protein
MGRDVQCGSAPPVTLLLLFAISMGLTVGADLDIGRDIDHRRPDLRGPQAATLTAWAAVVTVRMGTLPDR